MDTCRMCGAVVAPTGRYCHQCGSRLHPQHAQSESEYRLVTILCTDLSGYTRLSERLDHEELRTFMAKLLSETTRVIHGFGGTVEKYIGDAVVAIFGNHKTREDDPIRGILAAREIHKAVEGMNALLPQTVQTRLTMHTGISTGEVLVDTGRPAHCIQGTLGKPINVASRLCDLAEDGEILIGESLMTEAMRHFQLEWMGRRMLKGFRKPFNVYKVIAERPVPFSLHRTGGVTSPLVGRDRELSTFVSRARELKSGRGGIIHLIGEAGVGKSRLLHEFRANLDEGFSCIATSCFEYTSTTPYFPFLRLLHEVLGIEHPSALSSQGLPHEYAAHAAILMNMFSTAHDGPPGTLKEKVSDTILWLLTAFASRRHTVFCIEDIHWADQSSLDLLTYLIHKWDRSCPCLLIITQRSSFDTFISASRITLKELSEPEVASMLRNMLDVDSVSDGTVRSLARATGGNPFFIEEMANYLLEKGYDMKELGGMDLSDELPTTLYGLVTSRLDHMKPSSKRLLQEAALIGRIFHEDLLASVCSEKDSLKEGLSESAEHGFIQPLGTSRYIFKHEITRDVAGRTFLKKERVTLHRKIAQVLETRFHLCSVEHACELAHHFGRAHEFVKSAHYHIEAARHMETSGAWVEAGSHYLSAEHCVQKGGDIQGREDLLVVIREGIWRCCRVFDPARAIAALDALTDHYQMTGRRDEEAFCTIRLINLYSQRGHFEKSREFYARSLEIIPHNPVLVAAAQTAFAYTYTFLGRPLDALTLLEKARPVLSTADPFLYTVNVLTTLAASVWKGDLQGAHAWYRQLKNSSSAYMDIDLMADVWFAHICFLEGSFQEASRMFDDVLSREKKLGSLAGGLSYLRIQGAIYFRSRYFGDIQGAIADLDSFDALKGGLETLNPLKDLYRAWIALGEGRHALAKDLIIAALPGLRNGVANRVPYALNSLAQAHLLLGNHADALCAARESIAWNEERGNLDQLIGALRIEAEINISMGDHEAARTRLVQAYRLARSSGMRPHVAWVLCAFGKLLRGKGHPPSRSNACFRKARRLWEEMGNHAQAAGIEKEFTPKHWH